jgi:hypothetical protein
VLFVGDLLQLPPVVKDFAIPVRQRLITNLAYWPSITKFRLERPMRAPDPPEWADLLLAIAKGRLPEEVNWATLHSLGVTVTQSLDTALSFFRDDVDPRDLFPLDRQWICATNKLAKEINILLQQWRQDGGARVLGTILAASEILTPLPNSPGLALPIQIDFVERLDMPDLPPSELLIVEGDPLLLLRNINTPAGLAKGRRCTPLNIGNRTVLILFDNGCTQTLARIHLEKTISGMRFIRWQIPVRLVFAGTVHRRRPSKPGTSRPLISPSSAGRPARRFKSWKPVSV